MALLAIIYIWSLNLKDASILSLIVTGISVGVIFIPTVIGMFYWKRATAPAAAISMGAGMTIFLIKSLTPLGEYFPTEFGTVSWVLFISTILFIVVSLLTDSSKLEENRKHYRDILKI